MKRSSAANNLKPINKNGMPHVGRAKGIPNKISRTDAIIYAAEHSKHSKDSTLESYLVNIADNNKDLFTPLLGRLLPLQINGRTQVTNKIVYTTVAEVSTTVAYLF